jgi:hypothetical protein
MDLKLTLSLIKDVIEKAKKLATEHNMSLSSLIEYMFIKTTSKGSKYKSLVEIPVADFINKLAEFEPDCTSTIQKQNRKEEYRTRKY